jgi:hypothetical protein
VIASGLAPMSLQSDILQHRQRRREAGELVEGDAGSA